LYQHFVKWYDKLYIILYEYDNYVRYEMLYNLQEYKINTSNSNEFKHDSLVFVVTKCPIATIPITQSHYYTYIMCVLSPFTTNEFLCLAKVHNNIICRVVLLDIWTLHHRMKHFPHFSQLLTWLTDIKVKSSNHNWNYKWQ